jgi:hypothetical protein
VVLPVLAFALITQLPAPLAPEQQAAPVARPAAEAVPSRPVVATLAAVKTVYVLQMRSGFDQFLASALARDGHFEIVTDPDLADALLTDRVGKAFEKKLEELYPKPKPPVEEPPAGDDRDSAPGRSASELKSSEPPRTSSFGGGNGTIFLVSRGNRSVLWSSYEKAKSARPQDLNGTAKSVSHKLTEALKKAAMDAGGASKSVPPGN